MELLEIWKDVEGYEGSYQISNFGRVKSLIGNEKILNPRKNNFGYCQVALNNHRHRKNYLISRLVATAFINNPDASPYVNHIDSNPSNNHIDNLEWCTQRHNIQHSIKSKRFIGLRITCIKTGNKYNSASEAGRALKIPERTINYWLHNPSKNKSTLRFSLD
jgi:hypothetical protein